MPIDDADNYDIVNLHYYTIFDDYLTWRLAVRANNMSLAPITYAHLMLLKRLYRQRRQYRPALFYRQ
jgi:hypothetical protein